MPMIDSPYQLLCKAVEKACGFAVSTPSDFDRLSGQVFDFQHVTISISTLKRIWGYAGQSTTPRRFTLDTLSRFVGYKDYANFMESAGQPMESQSQLFLSDALTAEKLSPGTRLQLSWLPDRVCVVEHQGEGQFVVVKAEQTKLQVGDTFKCHLFINHEPLYIDNLQRVNLPPVSYVAGRQNGVTIRLLNLSK